MQMLSAEETRHPQAGAAVHPSIDALIEHPQAQLVAIDAEVDARIHASALWQEKQDLRQSVPGVEPTVSRTLIAALPELGTLQRHKISTLVGMAPLARDSGRSRGERHIWGGRVEVRAMLQIGFEPSAGPRRATARASDEVLQKQGS